MRATTLTFAVALLTPLAATATPGVAISRPGELSAELNQALELYDSQEYERSLALLRKVTRGRTNDDQASRRRAQFFVGKALFNLKRYEELVSTFAQIVETGPEHRYYGKTYAWLFILEGFTQSAVPHLARYSNAIILSGPGVDDYDLDHALYVIGAHLIGHGEPARGREFLTRVSPRGTYATKAREVLDGTAH